MKNIRGNFFGKKLRQFLIVGGLLLTFSFFVGAQDLPKEIRGYKVYRAKISVKNQSEKSAAKEKSEAFVKIGDPEVTNVSFTGVTFEISAEIDSPEQSGTVDFLMFRGFRVNNLPVEIEEYKHSFEVKKNQFVALPKPVEILLSVTQTLRGAINEAKNSQAEWTITGRIFVFGQFKKAGFKFKRVVPVDINLKIKNPVREN